MLLFSSIMLGENQNMKQSKTIPDEAEFNNLNKTALDGKKPLVQKSATEENIVSQAPTKDPDLDMSQLCRVFAQDSSQVIDYSQPCSKRADAIKNGFSASACLSAMRLRNRKLLNRLEWGQKPEHLNSGISDEMHIPGSQFSNSANTSRMKSTVCDSGFPPSTLSDVTQTEFSLMLQTTPYDNFPTFASVDIHLAPIMSWLASKIPPSRSLQKALHLSRWIPNTQIQHVGSEKLTSFVLMFSETFKITVQYILCHVSLSMPSCKA